MITNFRDWKLVSQEYYIYEIGDHSRYEILVEFHESCTPILASIASLYISGDYYDDSLLAGIYFKRKCLVDSKPLHEALEVAHRHYETNFNKEVIHNESKRTY